MILKRGQLFFYSPVIYYFDFNSIPEQKEERKNFIRIMTKVRSKILAFPAIKLYIECRKNKNF